MIREHPISSLKSWSKSWELKPGDEVSIRDDAWMLNPGYGIVIMIDGDFAWIEWASIPEPEPLASVLFPSTGSFMVGGQTAGIQPMPSGPIFYCSGSF